MTNLRCLVARAVFFSVLATEGVAASQSGLKISPQRLEAFQGGVLALRVSGPGVKGVRGIYKGAAIPFFPAESHGAFEAIVGVDLEEKPGPGRLTIRVGGRSQKRVPVPLRVKKKDFPMERLSVPKAFDTLDGETLKRVRRERARMESIWSRFSGQRLWERPFLVPVPGEETSAFGRRRVINGTPRSPHSGVDLGAELGEPIVAPNHGRVVLRGEFYFNGKSVVLDHGGGLYTMYFHLSEFRVKEGDPVRKGEVIGLVGMTGRVTGPHLHWGMRLNKARVDPIGLLNLPEGD